MAAGSGVGVEVGNTWVGIGADVGATAVAFGAQELNTIRSDKRKYKRLFISGNLSHDQRHVLT